MYVRAITCHPLDLPMSGPYGTSVGSFSSRRVLFVTVESDRGIATAECPVLGPIYSYETCETAQTIIQEYIAPAVIGQDLAIPEDYASCVGFIRGHPFARSAVEHALWDLWAKEVGLPLWRFLGGEGAPVPCQFAVGVKESIEELLAAIQEGVEQGYSQIKLKIRKGWDLAILERVRDAFPNLPLMVDANAGYTLDDLPMLRQLDHLGLEMIEQPLHYADLQEHAVLQRELTTPICLDESVKTIQDVQAAIALGSCRIVNIKIARVGGLAAAKRIATLCRENGLGVWCGGMIDTGLGNSYNLVAASLPEFTYPNDIQPSFTFFDHEFVRPHLELSEGGTITLPEGPGVGCEVDWEIVKRFSIS